MTRPGWLSGWLDRAWPTRGLRNLWGIPSTERRRTWQVGGWNVEVSARPPSNLFGRFGGGWQWSLGARLGGRTLLIDLLVISLTASRRNPTKQAAG